MIGQSRRELLDLYKKENLVFRATTRPYKSTASIVFDVVTPLGGPPAVMAHAIARANQNPEWFGYGIGDQIPLGGGLTKTAAPDDTNQSRGRRTNGVEDFVIEAISATCKGVRCEYAAADIPGAVLAGDPDARALYTGNSLIVDPGALVAPPQVGSPLNLKQTLMQAITPNLAITFTWDRGRVIPIGTLDQIPEGGAKSFLEANGNPQATNRYKAPEGYLWRRADKPDGDFVVTGQVASRVGIPITAIALAGAAAPLVLPVRVYVDVTLRVHGVGFQQIGAN